MGSAHLGHARRSSLKPRASPDTRRHSRSTQRRFALKEVEWLRLNCSLPETESPRARNEGVSSAARMP